MNIDDLTIGEARQLATMFANNTDKASKNINSAKNHVQ